MTLRADTNGVVLNGHSHGSNPASINGEPSRFRSQDHSRNHSPDDRDHRPSSAPGRKNGLSSSVEIRDDIGSQRPQRPNKPMLIRSKSEYARPQEQDESEQGDDEIPEWGARHGFEDHYQSEHIITQLASVRLRYSPMTITERADSV